MQAIQEPDLSSLQNMFEIVGQQKFISSQTLNGQTNQQISWQYRLAPQKEGQLTIPTIALKISSGQLHSQPLTVTVNKAGSKSSPNAPHLEATVSTPNLIYINLFTIHYTCIIKDNYEIYNQFHRQKA